jgi:hypothetical protein
MMDLAALSVASLSALLTVSGKFALVDVRGAAALHFDASLVACSGWTAASATRPPTIRAWGRAAEASMAARVAEACTMLRSSGRTLAAAAAHG